MGAVWIPLDASAQGNTYDIQMKVGGTDQENTVIRVGEDFVIEVALIAQNRRGGMRQQFYRNYKAPSFPAGLTVVDRSESTRSSVSIVNGRYTQEFSHVMSYVVRPTTEGLLTIGAASMDAEGKLYRSNGLQITVAPPRAAPKVILEGQNPDPQLADDEFLQVTVNREKVYLGQPVILSWYLYTTSRLTERPHSDPPESQGFFSKSLLSQNHTYEMERVVIGRQAFYRTMVYRRMYWPQRTGKLRIAARTVAYRTRSGFLNTGRTENRTSAEVEFQVMPLPAEGRPADFQEDHVGQYRMRLDLAAGSMKVGDAVDMTITLEGEALMTACRGPVLPKLNWARMEPNGSPVITEVIEGENQVRGSWKARYVFIATAEGDHEFPELVFSYFDPVAGQYATARTNPVGISVAPAPPGSRPTPVPGDFSVTPVDANILAPRLKPPAVTRVTNSSMRARFWKGSWRWFLAFLFPFAWGGTGLVLWVRRRRAMDVEALRKRMVKSRRRKGILQAKAALGANQGEIFYAECSRLLTDTLGECIGRSATGLVHAELYQELLQRNFPEELASEVLETLESFDFARYAPGSAQLSAEGTSQLEKTLKLVHQLDAKAG